MPNEPEYEAIRRTGGTSADDGPPEPDEPEYESIRRTGGESRSSEEERVGERASDPEDA